MAQDKSFGDTLYFSQWGGERPIPDVFIAAMERAEERTSGYVADAEIPQSVKDDVNVVDAFFDTRERRTNEKVLVVVRKKDGNITLRDFRTTDQGLTLQVDSTLFYTTDNTFVRSYPSATQDVAIKDLGNRWSIQEVAVMGTWVNGVFTPGIYQGIELTTRKDDPVGGPFTVGVDEEQTQVVTEGTVEQPVLTGDQLVGQQRQIAQSQKLTSTTTRDPVTLPKTEEYSAELLDLLPPRFRALLVTYKVTVRQSGVVAQPSLATGDLVKTEKQVTAVTKLVETLTRAGATFPIVITDTATITEYGGGKANIVSSIDVNGTYTDDEGEGVVSSKVTKLGEGHELKETVTRVAGSWPILPFSRFDARLQMVVSGTKQVVAKGSTTPGISSGVVTEVEEIDGYRERKVITTQPLSTVDSYTRVFDGNSTNVDVPPHLESLTGYIDLDGGAGSYSENGSYALGGSAYGGGSIQLRGSAQASASAVPEVGRVVKIPRTSNIPCTHVLCFVAFGVTRASIVSTISGILNAAGYGTCTDWPDFRPQPITIRTVGGKVNINVQVTVSAHDSVTTDYLGAMKFNSSSRSNGSGLSYDVSRISRIIEIPATIHGALSIAGDSSATTPLYAAQGTINGGVAGATANALVNGNVVYCSTSGAIGVVGSTSATSGDNSIPSSGKRVHRLVTEPDPVYNRVRVFAEVVNFADITP